jgi:hypothetical protein
VIGLLLSLLLILAGVGGPAGAHVAGGPPSAYPGPSPVVIPHPAHPKAGAPVAVLLAGMPRGARDVRLVADGRAWPAHPAGARSFLAGAIPRAAGPWQVDVRFRVGTRAYAELAGVLVVRPG